MANGSIVYKHNLLTGLNTDTFQRDIKKFSEPAPLNSCSAGEKYGGLVPWKKDSYTSTLANVVARKRLSNGKLVEIVRISEIGTSGSDARSLFIDGIGYGEKFLGATFNKINNLIELISKETGFEIYRIQDIWVQSNSIIRIMALCTTGAIYDTEWNISKTGNLTFVSMNFVNIYTGILKNLQAGYTYNTLSIYWYIDVSSSLYIGSNLAGVAFQGKNTKVVDNGYVYIIYQYLNGIDYVYYSTTHAAGFSVTTLTGFIIGIVNGNIGAWNNNKHNAVTSSYLAYYWTNSTTPGTIGPYSALNETAWPFGMEYETTSGSNQILNQVIGSGVSPLITCTGVTSSNSIIASQEFNYIIDSANNYLYTGITLGTIGLIPSIIGYSNYPIIDIGDIATDFNFISIWYNNHFSNTQTESQTVLSCVMPVKISSGDWVILYKSECEIIEFAPGLICIPGMSKNIIDTNTGDRYLNSCYNGVCYCEYTALSTATSEKLLAAQNKTERSSSIDTGGKASIPYYSKVKNAYPVINYSGVLLEVEGNIYINGINIIDTTDLYVSDSSFPISSSDIYFGGKSASNGEYTYFLDDNKFTTTLGNYWPGEWHLEELMGSEYLCNDYQIGLLTRNGILADSVSKLVDTTGKTFLANCQSYLLYVDTATNKLFKFQTDYILEEIKDCSQLEPIIGAVFDPYENVSYIYTAGSLYSFDGKKIETVQESFTGMTAIAPDKTITGVYWNSSLTASTRYTKIAPMPAGWTREIEPLLIATGYYGTDDNGTHTDQSYIIEVRNIGGASSVSLTVGRNYFTEDGLGTYEEQNYTVDTFDSSGYAYIKYNPSAPLSCIGSNLNIASSDDILIGNIYQYYYSDGQAIPSNQ